MDTADTNKAPWYNRVYRWGQTNLTELDPSRYDDAWWRSYWKKTQIQGVIVNAGGIVAYYPTAIPTAYRAQFLGDRDLFGEIAASARAEGLALLARMDTNRVHQALFEEHPEWIAVDREGAPYKRGELYVTCVTGGYYYEFVPRVLQEIVERYHPDGFTDNSYSGLDRRSICYCPRCSQEFRAGATMDLPPAADWNDPRYRRWITWSYGKRMDVWDFNNAVTQKAGGEHCRWIGMVGGNVAEESVRLRDLREICSRTAIIMLDFQRRSVAEGFQSNAISGKLLHDLAGWDTLIPESMAMYQNGGRGEQTFRLSAKPKSEVRLWAFEGFAGGIQPWWHHIGAYHEDRRQYDTPPELFEWHKRNESYLIGREPVAPIGVIWSQENIDFYGRDHAEFEFSLPWRGMTQALIRSRIPFMPVHADNIRRYAGKMQTLVLANVGALSYGQIEALEEHVGRGGSLIASGRIGIFDERGDLRKTSPLSRLLGVEWRDRRHGVTNPRLDEWEAFDAQSYLRVERASLSGEAAALAAGFEESDILPFGGCLEVVDLAPESSVTLTYVPPFPIYPPELAWMRQPATTLPACVHRTDKAGGRIVYFSADIDRLYGRFNSADHFALLRNAFHWSLAGVLPIEIDGPGLVDLQLYRQGARLLVHLTNLNNEGAWRVPVSEIVEAGPYVVRIREELTSASHAELTVSGGPAACTKKNGWVEFTIGAICEHELAVLE